MTIVDVSVFPTAGTVPFPYDSPYPQQEALMDAMLQSLQQIEISRNGDAKFNSNKAKVMLLESPTGTGKSLSLACASIAWLKHMEQLNLESQESQILNLIHSKDEERHDDFAKSSGDKINSNSKSWSESHSDSWSDPLQISKREEKERKQVCQKRAKSARMALEKELNSIRLQIDQLSNSSKPNPTCHKNFKGDSIEKSRASRIIRSRENLARAAVTSALLATRKKYRKSHMRRIKNNKTEAISKFNLSPNQSRNILNDGHKNIIDDNDFCLHDYNSDDNNEQPDDNDSLDIESDDSKQSKEPALPTNFSDLIDGSLLDGSNQSNSINTFTKKNKTAKTAVGDVEAGSGVRKIIYSARTHSQLSQFIGEIRRTAWSNSIRVVPLGSRKILCGNREVLGIAGNHSNIEKNSAVLSYKSETRITEHCLDLQKGISSSNKNNGNGENNKSIKKKRKRSRNSEGCPLLSSRDAIATLAVHMLAKPSDIEDLANLGSASNACSYYASREALSAAEVVVVPYNILLSKKARNAIGLSLKKSLVIIDEAHNLPEVLRSLHACRLSQPVAEAASMQLTAYIKRYSSRLSGKNLFYLGQIQKCLHAIVHFLGSKQAQTEENSKCSKLMTTTGALFALKLDNVNLFKVERYFERSRLDQKLHGFATNLRDPNMEKTLTNTEDDSDFISKHISPLSIVRSFLLCLNTSSADGKVVVEWPVLDENEKKSEFGIKHASFRYVLLNPAAQFEDIVDEAHAIALVGGTIRPFTHIASELLQVAIPNALEDAAKADNGAEKSSIASFSSISSQVTTFSCGHVVPSSNVLMMCLSSGPTGTKLDFRHSSRYSDRVCDELGRSLVNFCNIVTKGLVVFLQSYSYEVHLMRRWKKTGLLNQLEKRKRIHREPKSARNVEDTLTSYSNDAKSDSTGGAILFCVVGGKVSEGINFADDMARCVFMVGLPYADVTNPELQEKMQSLDRQKKRNKNAISGRSYYHNLCMRAVNQSIGRAIRHANDYAAVVLADVRFTSDKRVWEGLPMWLRNGQLLSPNPDVSFGKKLFQLKVFYKKQEKLTMHL